jgi:hypothetical protein
MKLALLATIFHAFLMGLSVFGPFALSAVLAFFLRPAWKQGWRLLLALSLVYAGFFFLALGLPFFGIVAELLTIAAASAALVLPMTVFLRTSRHGRNMTIREGLLAFLWLPLTAAVLTTLISRVNYARGLSWACDGPIVEVTRAAGNHNLPTLVVQNGVKRARFENVDESLWSQAKPGLRLAKAAGSPSALLDGQRLRMVPRQMRWWSEPR